MKQAFTFENQLRKQFHGWILYQSGDSSFNPHYVDLYRSACQKRELSIALAMYDPSANIKDIMNQMKHLPASEKPVYVINRTRDYQLAECLESLGIRVFNHSYIAKIGNDKSRAYRYMQQQGIPVMPTSDRIDTPPHWYPAVVKSNDGHGGTEVFYIRDEMAWKDWKQRWLQNEKHYVVQQAASDLGKDVRVYVVGNEIKAAILRRSENDFRSNYCLGGSIKLYQLSDDERQLVERTMRGLSIGMAGIDYIFHQGKMVFNEIEDMVGARGLYSLTDYNIVEDYMNYIQEELQHDANTGKSTDL